MIYLLALILIIVWLIWRIRSRLRGKGGEVKEGFYTLFLPYHTDKVIKVPNYTKYTNQYMHKLLKVGVVYNKKDMFAVNFINDLFTNILTTAFIEKVKITSDKHDYRLLEDLSQKQIDLAVVSEPVLTKIMVNDIDYMDSNPIIGVNNSSLQFLTNIGRKYIYIVTLVKSGIENIQQLVGKKVSIGVKKSASWIFANDLFNYLKYDVQKVETSIDLALLQLYNERLDAIVFADYYPNRILVNMSLNESDDQKKKFRILPITYIDTTRFETEFFYYKKATLDLNKLPQSFLPVTADQTKYNRFNPDLVTYGFDMSLICLATLPVKTAHTIVKTIFENRAIVKKAEMSRTEMSITFVPIAIHKGADKYYTEKGYSTNSKSSDCIYFVGKDKCTDTILEEHGFSNPRRKLI